MTYLKWRRKKTVNQEFWIRHNYPSRTKENGKHSQIDTDWGSLLLIDLLNVKCCRVAFRPTADVLCLFFGVGPRTYILNKTYGFLNQKQKNKPKTKLHNEVYFSIQQIDKNWKKKKKSPITCLSGFGIVLLVAVSVGAATLENSSALPNQVEDV